MAASRRQQDWSLGGAIRYGWTLVPDRKATTAMQDLLVRAPSRETILRFVLTYGLVIACLAGPSFPRPAQRLDDAQAHEWWAFQHFGVGAAKYYETHVQDNVVMIDLNLVRAQGGGSGTLQIRALQATSTALPGVNYDLPAASIPFTASDTQLEFPLIIHHRGSWYKERWLWLEVVGPAVPRGEVGRLVLVGIRPANSVSPPSVHFARATTALTVGSSANIEVRLTAPSDERVRLHYTIEEVTPGALAHITVPASGSLILPPGMTESCIDNVQAGPSSAGASVRIRLNYENANESEVNRFFGTHSWTHTNTEAHGIDGMPSFRFPGDEQGFMVGGWCDTGYETDAFVQQAANPLEHFDGSGPVLGVVVDEDARVAPYVRPDSEIATDGVDGPDGLIRMGNYQELVVFMGQFTGVDATLPGGGPRNSNDYRVILRSRTANISHILEIRRDSTDGDPDLIFPVDGINWAVTRVANIHPDDEIIIRGIDYEDGFGMRPVLIYRHVTDPQYDYVEPCAPGLTGCGQPCGFECARDRANVIISPHFFGGDGGCADPLPQSEIGRGALFYGVTYRTMDVDPRGTPLPRFWERKGLWPEPRGNARMDYAATIVSTVKVR